MIWMLYAVGVVAALVALVVTIGALLPKKHVASRRAHFKQTPEAIWDVITCPPTWRADVKTFELLPEQNGHRVWREEAGGNMKITFEAVEAKAPHRLVTRILDKNLPFGGSWTHEIARTDDGCMLTITENGEMYNPIFRFMSRFIFGQTATIDRYLRNLGKKFDEQITIEG